MLHFDDPFLFGRVDGTRAVQLTWFLIGRLLGFWVERDVYGRSEVFRCNLVVRRVRWVLFAASVSYELLAAHFDFTVLLGYFGGELGKLDLQVLVLGLQQLDWRPLLVLILELCLICGVCRHPSGFFLPNRCSHGLILFSVRHHLFPSPTLSRLLFHYLILLQINYNNQ